MKGKKCFTKLGLILISLFVGVAINIKNANAYEFFSNFNITAFSYKSDLSSNPVITLNSINNNASTPYVNDAFNGTFHTIISPKFTLNKVANLSKTRRFLLRFEIFTQTTRNDSISYANTGFQCPYGSGDIKVANCKIMTSDYETIMERTSLNNPGQGEELTVSITSNKTYIVELEIYNNSELPVPITEIALAGRPLSVSLSSNANSIPTGFSWQFTWITASAFYYENPNAAAEALNEQNEKDNQDRTDLQTQQEETDETAEDQEEAAKTTGQTLFSAFSSLVSALGNVHQTNCRLPNMSVYTITLNNMDLCSVNLPNGVSALAGIAMCFIIVKMGISLVHRMLNLYKEIIG